MTKQPSKTDSTSSGRRVLVGSIEGQARPIPGVAKPSQDAFRTAANTFVEHATKETSKTAASERR